MEHTLKIATYNIHKGMSAFNRRHVLPALKQALGGLTADLVFLQEVQGEHRHRAGRHADWPSQPQHAFLAGDHHHVYGRNADYRSGHHGNALLSRYPIEHWHNHDLSLNPFERRGLLHGRIALPERDTPLHALCVHLNLRAADRRQQLAALADYAKAHIPAEAALIVAGDFNDWRQEACGYLQDTLGLREAFHTAHGRLAASFPARMPILTLDRIYLRGFSVQQAQVHVGPGWQGLSDHAPLSAIVRAH
ncbi:endonuclease/exonuclease/phosphatase family protein [Chitinimonas koreensis]|uniref:endonuclease/exonuclease/phosphatase family protein n=1 Tax=Chitinimonas koreensis TaxID=356302 RepID=UPI0003FD4C8C|nr:endonuclease/exonuclease/phosphatase family protein [Chitinimonas koreensis]QNM95211.1 endonuclease/exonuclease/phosphatase family protein [Chitinimonas koreensis]